MTYLIANWKSHKTIVEAQHWLNEFHPPSHPDITVILAAPFIHLPVLKPTPSLHLAAQDVSPFPDGAYTGAVSARQLEGLVEYVLLGHSERRRYFHETHQDVANKVAQALSVNLTPIVCIDQPYLSAQLSAIEPVYWPHLIVAYEPLSAIGTGDPEDPSRANTVARQVKDILSVDVPVIYGGSATSDNIGTFFSQPALAGALIGQSSLDPHTFADLVKSSL